MTTEVKRSLGQLWQEYLFLTTEMKKFLDKQDFDLFNELIRQREALQQIIDKTPDDGFRITAGSKACFQVIYQQNQLIRSKLEYLRNMAKRQNEVSSAYDSFTSSSVGSRMDWQL